MIGILPAAGEAKRIHGLPKYLLPVGDSYLLKRQIEMMQRVGDLSIYIGTNINQIATIHQHTPKHSALPVLAVDYKTMTDTVMSVYDYYASRFRSKGPYVLFGMPDSYIEDENIYRKISEALYCGADVAVAVFLARPDQHQHVGMVYTDGERVTEAIDKPESTAYLYCWGALGWSHRFWRYMQRTDPHVGYALPRAIDDNLKVQAIFADGEYWDCGTPDEYFALIRHLTGDQ